MMMDVSTMTNVSMMMNGPKSVAALLAQLGPLERLDDDDNRLDDDECLDEFETFQLPR